MSSFWFVGLGAVIFAIAAGYAVKDKEYAPATVLALISLLLGIMSVAKYLGGILNAGDR